MKNKKNDVPEKENKIIKKQIETTETKAEADRRLAVAYEKFGGYLIEYIEIERRKQKKKQFVGSIFGCYMRTCDLRSNLLFSMTKNEYNFSIFINSYEIIQKEVLNITKLLEKPEPEFPIINETNSAQDLNIAVGQIEKYLLGLLIECM